MDALPETVSRWSRFLVWGIPVVKNKMNNYPIAFNKHRKKQHPPKKTKLSLKIWLGMNFSAWIKVLKEAQYGVNVCCLHSAIVISLSSLANSLLSIIETGLYRKKVAATEIKHPPLFIIGYWRTGTTLLHELLALDEHHNYPNTYQCFFPGHFLLTEWIGTKIMDLLLPDKRPMDAMPIGSLRPQEDEFALCNLGEISPYRGIVFPQMLEQCAQYLRIADLSEKRQQEWRNTLVWFYKKLTYRSQKRLIIKSPTHSFRIALLAKLFPGAKFVHITRNPYRIYQSTHHLWMALLDKQGLQRIDPDIINRYVKQSFVIFNQAVSQDTKYLERDQYYTLAYEDLVDNPAKTLEPLYRAFKLGDFESIRKRVQRYQKTNSNYKTNTYDLTQQDILEINNAWVNWIKRQGYTVLDPQLLSTAGKPMNF